MKKYISFMLAVIMLVLVMAGCTESTADLELGTVSDDGVYHNNFASISFTLPDGWTYFSDEQKAELMGVSSEMMSEKNNKTLVEYAMDSTVYDMVASSADGTENVMIMFENTARYLGGKSLSEDGYLDALIKQLEDMTEYSYEIGERTDVKLGSTSYRCLSVSVPEYNLYQDYLVHRVEKYMAVVCLTSAYEGAPADALGEYFS